MKTVTKRTFRNECHLISNVPGVTFHDYAGLGIKKSNKCLLFVINEKFNEYDFFYILI